ncbi:hypothetical protein ElyMa_003812900 [Elysia marginata]|uniref:Uncharacterized protein n=1 Tax=Elysia marginata TaxID=1093978 RepID=A0AAV4FDR6_9GAST|nr:hypothetical protein ElyMa_003812900 [Elysia marginata]
MFCAGPAEVVLHQTGITTSRQRDRRKTSSGYNSWGKCKAFSDADQPTNFVKSFSCDAFGLRSSSLVEADSAAPRPTPEAMSRGLSNQKTHFLNTH